MLEFRAKRRARRVGPEARPDSEAGPVVRAVGIVAFGSFGNGDRPDGGVADAVVRSGAV
jgi:hypothetical protein